MGGHPFRLCTRRGEKRWGRRKISLLHNSVFRAGTWQSECVRLIFVQRIGVVAGALLSGTYK